VDLFKTKNKIKNEEKIDLIVMDLNMIKMNGDEATRQVILSNKR
jgi:CheY-like chemotaxis protein